MPLLFANNIVNYLVYVLDYENQANSGMNIMSRVLLYLTAPDIYALSRKRGGTTVGPKWDNDAPIGIEYLEWWDKQQQESR